MAQTTTTKTLEILYQLFGFPEQIVSDNGHHFISVGFHQFMTRNVIRHICCMAYHPAPNGQD